MKKKLHCSQHKLISIFNPLKFLVQNNRLGGEAVTGIQKQREGVQNNRWYPNVGKLWKSSGGKSLECKCLGKFDVTEKSVIK